MKQLVIFLCLMTALFSCENEKIIKPDFLLGKWLVIEASRNNKSTNTLDGAFFFFEENILTTNFQGFENQAEYTIENNHLKLTKGLDYTFHLEKSEMKYLIMSVKIQNTNFVFKLKRE
jgi:hypothetical protein